MFSTISAFPGFMSPQRLNPVEPPRYGSVCQVVWEGRRREASPYPDQPIDKAEAIWGAVLRAKTAFIIIAAH